VLSVLIYILYTAHRHKTDHPDEDLRIRSEMTEEIASEPLSGRLQAPLETPGARLGTSKQMNKGNGVK
jgi:hypothetical protein